MSIQENEVIHPIQKIFTGVHVDLDKVLDIGKAMEDYRSGRGFSFDINFQLRDKAVEYFEECEDYYDVPDSKSAEYLKAFQSKVDDLIDLWKRYKMQECETIEFKIVPLLRRVLAEEGWNNQCKT